MGKRVSGLWADFKAFINKGNVMGLAVAVVLGGAFGALVNALARVLLVLATCAVPGGLAGLVTVIPPINELQSGYERIVIPGVEGTLKASYDLQEWVELRMQAGASAAFLGDLYTVYGGTYYYKNLAILDWGTLIIAFISFIVVAIVLFTIVKIATRAQAATKTFTTKAGEKVKKKQ